MPNETLRMRGMPLSLYILRSHDDAFSLGAAQSMFINVTVLYMYLPQRKVHIKGQTHKLGHVRQKPCLQTYAKCTDLDRPASVQ